MPAGHQPRRVLAVGAHPDDIEIGCGGTLISHVDAGDDVTMLVMTDGGLGKRQSGTEHLDRRAEALAAAEMLGARVYFGPFRDGNVPMTSEAVDFIEATIREHDIDTLYCHGVEDSHQDHVLVGRAAAAAGRRLSRVMHYQGPTTGRFHPTLFVDISKQFDRKVSVLSQHESQVVAATTLDLEVIASTARYWGSRSRLGLAEAFEVSRFAWSITD